MRALCSYRFFFCLIPALAFLGKDRLSACDAASGCSAYTPAAAMEAIPYDRDKALHIIDSAYIVGNISDYCADILRMKAYTQSPEGIQLDSTLAIGERLMQNDSVVQNPGKRQTVMNLLVDASRKESTEQQRKAMEAEKVLRSRILVLSIFFGSVLFVFLFFWVVLRSKPTDTEGWKHRLGPLDPPVLPPIKPSDMNDEELFLYLSDIIRREKLFLNPLLDRQAIIRRLGGLSAHRIGAAFSKGSEFHSLPGYVRNLRLEYACMLLVSHPDLSVKAVGEASGFSNTSTFCADFKTQYGITPSDYRQEKLSP